MLVVVILVARGRSVVVIFIDSHVSNASSHITTKRSETVITSESGGKKDEDP